jgi:hypothetical protein
MDRTLGSCMEYFVNHDLLAHLERLSEKDRPHGIKCRFYLQEFFAASEVHCIHQE